MSTTWRHKGAWKYSFQAAEWLASHPARFTFGRRPPPPPAQYEVWWASASLDCSLWRKNPCPANVQPLGWFNQTRHPVPRSLCTKCWGNRPLCRQLYTFSAVLQTVELLLHQTQSFYNQRLEVNWWQAERQACIPRRFYFITQETVNKMYESYRRIMLRRDKKKKSGRSVWTQRRIKNLESLLSPASISFPWKPLRGIYPDCMVSSFIKGLDTPQCSRRLSGRVVAEGTRTNINIYVHINGTGVYLRVQCKVTYHFWTRIENQERPLSQCDSALHVQCFHNVAQHYMYSAFTMWISITCTVVSQCDSALHVQCFHNVTQHYMYSGFTMWLSITRTVLSQCDSALHVQCFHNVTQHYMYSAFNEQCHNPNSHFKNTFVKPQSRKNMANELVITK